MPTTLYGAGYNGITLYGGTGETNFVGGAGIQYLDGGRGANIFTYLAMSDGGDQIMDFDPAKDVIDLSHIDANLTPPGVQNFTFIGTAPFSGSGAQVRYQQDPTHDVTYVQAALAGDSSPDFTVKLDGLRTLTAANFALTATQSSTDMAAGAALGGSTTRIGSGSEIFYTNVKGKPYSTYEALYTNTTNQILDNLNFSSSANELDLGGGVMSRTPLTITRGSGSETVSASSINFPLAYHRTETIQAANAFRDTFALGTGFGNETINGFTPSGAYADTIQLSTSSFSYLATGMSQAQDLAAVLSHAVANSGGTTITNSFGDSLTLTGLTPATITANASHFTFV